MQNVFVIGDNIDITLDEPEVESSNSDREFPLTPGATYTKDPTITVKAGSAPLYLFFKMEKSANLDDFVDYEVKSSWTELSGVDDVYYIALTDKTESDTPYTLLVDDKVTINADVTKTMIDALTEDTTRP